MTGQEARLRVTLSDALGGQRRHDTPVARAALARVHAGERRRARRVRHAMGALVVVLVLATGALMLAEIGDRLAVLDDATDALRVLTALTTLTKVALVWRERIRRRSEKPGRRPGRRAGPPR